MKPFVKEFDMKKRFLAFLLAVCIACSMLVVAGKCRCQQCGGADCRDAWAA